MSDRRVTKVTVEYDDATEDVFTRVGTTRPGSDFEYGMHAQWRLESFHTGGMAPFQNVDVVEDHELLGTVAGWIFSATAEDRHKRDAAEELAAARREGIELVIGEMRAHAETLPPVAAHQTNAFATRLYRELSSNVTDMNSGGESDGDA